ncbi:MAG TPA: hypothetical protein VEA99_09750, partial [Gemmatimonadaceae bacterium]|nr:hypothetical protein [Gemmatimonadaceae bacterium]
GKHADVACAKCHLAPRLRPPLDSAGRPVPVFKPIAFRDCASCHADPHRGALKGSCTSCHSTSSFAAIDRRGFDHDRTRYPLRGRHAAATCASCHVGFPSAGMRPPFATCASCHRDPHEGQGTLAGRPVDCAACHRVEGFTPATLTVAQHQATAFPLRGRHARVACSACHAVRASISPASSGARARRVVELRPASRDCADCHADPHAGQSGTRVGASSCAGCHGEDDWRRSTLVPSAHAALALPLDGAHERVGCAACHGARRKGLPALPATRALGAARVAFRIAETTCAQCHADPHRWRAAGAGARDCANCHDARRFRPATMDAARHATTAWPLEGAHRAVPCAACHREPTRPAAAGSLIAARAAPAALDLRVASTACGACHADPHGTVFGRAAGAACEGCHTVDAFTPARGFDHARASRFPLEGAHARLRCDACHRRTAGTAPTYAGLSRTCESCHADGLRPPRGRR